MGFPQAENLVTADMDVLHRCHLVFFEIVCQKLNGLATWPFSGLF